MAQATITKIEYAGEVAHVVSWTLTQADGTGDAVELPGSPDRSAQIRGTFNGATVVVEGSNDGTNYETLTDPQGNAISKTAAAIEAITEMTRKIRPKLTGGDGSTSVVVSMFFRRTR